LLACFISAVFFDGCKASFPGAALEQGRGDVFQMLFNRRGRFWRWFLPLAKETGGEQNKDQDFHGVLAKYHPLVLIARTDHLPKVLT
jgi:hypothetical protein